MTIFFRVIPITRGRVATFLSVALFTLLCLAAARPACGQAEEAANAGRGRLWVGGSINAATLGYGDRRMLGGTAFVDGDTFHHIGLEGEARWLDFHQTANVHAETYLGGLRFHMNHNRYQFYGKTMVGTGHFNFPYNFATGNYLVLAWGGGVDYALGRRWKSRADFEYQDWPQFTYGRMSSISVSVGLRYRVF